MTQTSAMNAEQTTSPTGKRARRLIGAALLGVLASFLSWHGSAFAQSNTVSGTVSRVTDGDTFQIRGLDRAIRVWGLDAPERNEVGAAAATTTMTRLVSGQDLTCRVRDIDRYGRIVGQCFLPDGRDIAAEMIRAGVATEYCRFSGGYYRTC